MPHSLNRRDTKLVIFVNGLWGTFTYAHGGGTAQYFGRAWVETALRTIGDNRAWFFDGSANAEYSLAGSDALAYSLDYSNRIRAGYLKGKAEAPAMIAALERNAQGQVTESIKLIGASMGCAFARGLSSAITEYVAAENARLEQTAISVERLAQAAMGLIELPQPLRVVIEFSLDLDAFQAEYFGQDGNARTSYYMRMPNSFVGGVVPGGVEIGNAVMRGHHPSFAPAQQFPQASMNPQRQHDWKEHPVTHYRNGHRGTA